MDPAFEAPASFEFGRFKVLPQHREVLANGRPLQLGGRAFDVLLALIEANGAVVSKDELMSRVWIARPIILYDRSATCWQPYVKGPTMMVDNIINSNRREDWWLDKSAT